MRQGEFQSPRRALAERDLVPLLCLASHFSESEEKGGWELLLDLAVALLPIS